MKVSRSRLIVDTNVLIDLHRGGIVEQFFALPFEFVSPDVIIAELEEPDGRALELLGLISAELGSDQVLEVDFLWEHNLDIAVNDIFALVLASHAGLPLLTGDRRLRVLADKHRVTVHGTFWILDEMVGHSILTKGQAAHALRRMLDAGSRLPPTECAQRLRLWEGK
jgi:predicted nucleic acid-binding protein